MGDDPSSTRAAIAPSSRRWMPSWMAWSTSKSAKTSAGCCQAASMAAGLRQAPSTTF